jgi:hypothetical protein
MLSVCDPTAVTVTVMGLSCNGNLRRRGNTFLSQNKLGSQRRKSLGFQSDTELIKKCERLEREGVDTSHGY